MSLKENKQKTAYEILSGLVGSEMCIRDRGRGDVLEGKQAEEVLELLKSDAERTYDNYETMLNERFDGSTIDENKKGLARELARMNLTPVSYTHLTLPTTPYV